ncbi:hypothetical protein DIPPA_02232 [Diplonema papillatum]|nr:hypothetical protein DIPPA_02232 [Diplonema papillatum]
MMRSVAMLSMAALAMAANIGLPVSCETVLCASGTTCQKNSDGTIGCYSSCQTECGFFVPDGWSGNGDGSNTCDSCTCSGGVFSCEAGKCLDSKKCPSSPCESAKSTCPSTGCPVNQVCLNDPSTRCFGRSCDGSCCVMNACAWTSCGTAEVCKLDYLGRPTCVPQPKECCLAIPVCPPKYEEVDSCPRASFETGACLYVTLCCTSLICSAL